ncbi:MAG: C69 family dipeptidase [Proteobacteria bacterium]|nr:C69 family dipeptidase [Pseudomonadota bacterium]
MCDTQLIKQEGETYFAKNSDREASEPQIVCYVPAKENAANTKLQTTYLSLPQIARTHGVILSKPLWMWGAEMGVNDRGVVIGNEAVFTKLVEKKGKALLGMDLVRLGLERGNSAAHALQCITQLLETHGQGGPAGFRDKSFRYDNSFIIADSGEAWILETAGRHWVAKQIANFGAISNTLSIENDFDLCSRGLIDFARKSGYFSGRGQFSFARAFDTRFMKRMGCAEQRRHASQASLGSMFSEKTATFASLAASLRQHASHSPHFSRHSNRDICMHAGGISRPSQTCSSMIVRLRRDKFPQLMLTGTSSPCLSLFQPVWFPGEASHKQSIFSDEGSEERDNFWFRFERVHRRALIDCEFRSLLCGSRDELEGDLFASMEGSGSIEDGAALAEQWHSRWGEAAGAWKPAYRWYSLYDRYWKRLNRMDGML